MNCRNCRTPDSVRFERHFVKATPDECWEWTGRRSTYGYGAFRTGGTYSRKQLYAHRFAYELYVGPIPDGLLVCHHCDNRLCVNPAHLFLGTIADNMRDAAVKGRKMACAKRGERHYRARLTEEQVREMRQLRETTSLTLDEIGTRFGVAKHVVYHVVHRKTWKHVA